ncbi:MAG: ABC transporter substrate-binding protein [Stellaceae bacterium]
MLLIVWRRLAAAALAFVVLGGTAAATEPPVIRIAWVIPVANWASILYAKTDLMRHYGKTYRVEPVHFKATPPMISALAVGELDIADLAFSSFALAVENAGMKDLRVIADEAQDGAHGYRSVPYYVLKSGPVKTMEDLKGKIVATVSPGAALDIPVRAMLRRHGLETPHDYTMVEAAFPNMLPMLMDHKIDMMPSVNPFALDPRLDENARPLFTASEAMGGPTETIVWVAHKSFLDQHRGAMVDFLEDAVRVARYLTDPANHDAAVAIAAKIVKQPPEKLGYIFTKADTYRDPGMRPDLGALQRAVDVQHETGFLKAKLDVRGYADLGLLDQATKRIK